MRDVGFLGSFFYLLKFVSLHKLSHIMNDVRIKFYGTENSEDTTLEVFCNSSNEIYIGINVPDLDNLHITLNKATAAQLVKKLKLEISKIQKL